MRTRKKASNSLFKLLNRQKEPQRIWVRTHAFIVGKKCAHKVIILCSPSNDRITAHYLLGAFTCNFFTFSSSLFTLSMKTMARFFSICTLLSVTSTATAFCPQSHTSRATTLFAIPHDPRVSRSMNAMDQNRAAPNWTVGDGYGAPPPSTPAAPAVVDPPKRENLWTNYQDKPRGERKGLSRFL